MLAYEYMILNTCNYIFICLYWAFCGFLFNKGCFCLLYFLFCLFWASSKSHCLSCQFYSSFILLFFICLSSYGIDFVTYVCCVYLYQYRLINNCCESQKSFLRPGPSFLVAPSLYVPSGLRVLRQCQCYTQSYNDNSMIPWLSEQWGSAGKILKDIDMALSGTVGFRWEGFIKVTGGQRLVF